MDAGAPETIAIINRMDLKLPQKLGELAALLSETQPEPPEARLSNLMQRAEDIASKFLLGEGEVDKTKHPSSRQANFETPKVSILCADYRIRRLKLFGYNPDEKYSPSLNATWSWINQAGMHQSYMEYVSEKMFRPDNATYNPNAAGLLSLLEQSVDIYSRAKASGLSVYSTLTPR
jgi:hypothetical protein